ncbi:MAG: PD-(D/E)XK nuclease family protein [Cyanobacteria bacterium J06639_1]
MHPHLQRITHVHLNAIANAPERFEAQFVNLTELPNLPKNAAALERGRQFHQVMQQHFLGLDVSPLLDADADLDRYFQAYRTSPPELLDGDRQAERALTSACGGFQLYGVLDLLVEGGDRAQIVDWKTYRHPPTVEHLRRHWQTRLYLYLLADNFEGDRAALSMTYWFAEAPEHSVVIPYSQADYDRDRADIQHLLDRLQQWLPDRFPTQAIAPTPALAVETMPELPLP